MTKLLSLKISHPLFKFRTSSLFLLAIGPLLSAVQHQSSRDDKKGGRRGEEEESVLLSFLTHRESGVRIVDGVGLSSALVLLLHPLFARHFLAIEKWTMRYFAVEH